MTGRLDSVAWMRCVVMVSILLRKSAERVRLLKDSLKLTCAVLVVVNFRISNFFTESIRRPYISSHFMFSPSLRRGEVSRLKRDMLKSSSRYVVGYTGNGLTRSHSDLDTRDTVSDR